MSSALAGIGSTGILEAIKENAPSVKRVVITSLFAAILDPNNNVGKICLEISLDPYNMGSG